MTATAVNDLITESPKLSGRKEAQLVKDVKSLYERGYDFDQVRDELVYFYNLTRGEACDILNWIAGY
jgi:hypothetical protein